MCGAVIRTCRLRLRVRLNRRVEASEEVGPGTAATLVSVLQVAAVVHVLLSLALVGLVLMHSGRDTGLGGMGFTPASQGGTHIVERNLTRLTVAVGILFFANTVLLFHLLK